MNRTEAPFIPAKESRWFIRLFDIYVRNLFWRHFRHVWIQLEYTPQPGDKTIYYLNHTSWWDGLIPFLLNQKVFRQNARAMMEDKQMRKYKFFKRIGAFSVNLDDSRDIITSLRYAVKSLESENSSLFIYPEGEIMPFSTQKPEFKKGLAWINSKTNDVILVPIGIYIHTAKTNKPELFIKVGAPVQSDRTNDLRVVQSTLENALHDLLLKLKTDAHHNIQSFKKL
ncbi:MAG: lysophospholipid acyltransferase family protein [Balneolaceae bacterium]